MRLSLLSLLGIGLATSAFSENAPVPQAAVAAQEVKTDVASADLESHAWDGIVRIEASFLTPDYRTPWQSGLPSSGNGTGWLVGKNRFITNAHVVSNATKLMIRTSNDPEPHEARVLFIAHDCDLAMIEAVNPKHFEKLTPLEVDGIPKLNSEVIAVGFPIGGDRVSVTRGVVSRIDFQSYSHTGIDQHLAIQVDAAINPGNSGGPVLQNGKVVGVAFQGYGGSVAQNVGYMIPTPVIKRFLDDVKDGSYDHYMDLATTVFPIENPAQVKAFGLEDNGIGVQVAKVESLGSGAQGLKEKDVILSIDGNPVYNNGLIRVDGALMDMNEVVERKFAGDVIQVELLRDRKKQTVNLTLKRFLPYLTMGEAYNQRPKYLLYAGLLFQPMNRNLLVAHGIRNPLVSYYFENYLAGEIYKEYPEVVILTAILPDEVNSYLSGFQHSIVEEVNGTKIRSMLDLDRALKAEGSKKEFVEIKLLEVNRPLVLRRDLAEEAHPRILQTYQVKEDRYLGNE